MVTLIQLICTLLLREFTIFWARYDRKIVQNCWIKTGLVDPAAALACDEIYQHSNLFSSY